MRHKDPELMKQINDYIGDFYAINDRTPSTTEIAKHFGIARSTSQNYLVAMNKSGMLLRDNSCKWKTVILLRRTAS